MNVSNHPNKETVSSFEGLILPTNMSSGDRKKIQEAAQLMEEIHAGQLRKSGQNYKIHPYSILQQIIDAHPGSTVDILVVALLHDALEHHPTQLDGIYQKYEQNIVFDILLLSKYDNKLLEILEKKENNKYLPNENDPFPLLSFWTIVKEMQDSLQITSPIDGCTRLAGELKKYLQKKGNFNEDNFLVLIKEIQTRYCDVRNDIQNRSDFSERERETAYKNAWCQYSLAMQSLSLSQEVALVRIHDRIHNLRDIQFLTDCHQDILMDRGEYDKRLKKANSMLRYTPVILHLCKLYGFDEEEKQIISASEGMETSIKKLKEHMMTESTKIAKETVMSTPHVPVK